MVRKYLWGILDPLLVKIGSRLLHLGAIRPVADIGYLKTISELHPSVVIDQKAVLHCVGLPDQLVIGAYSFIEGNLLVLAPGGRIRIGHHCVVGANSRIWAQEGIEIGDYVMISHSVDIHDSDSHPMDAQLRREHLRSFCEYGRPGDATHAKALPVRIEDDVWIGMKATILKGVTVGRGAVVAAGSVVTRSVPPYALVAGNPAQILRMLA